MRQEFFLPHFCLFKNEKKYYIEAMISTARLQLIFFMILTAGVSVLIFFIFKPYLAPIFLAAIIAIVFHPFYKRLLKIFGDKKSLVSLITVLIVLAVILVPSIFIGISLFEEATTFYNHISFGQYETGGFLNTVTGFFENKIRTFAPKIPIDAGEYLKKFASWLAGNLDNFFSGFFNIFIDLIIMIISLFYFLRDGERMAKGLVALSPLADYYDEQIIKKVGLAINSIVRGSLIIALVKGFLTAVGFAIFSVPNPILWGAVSAFASLIPFIGSWIVIAPALFYLFTTGLYVNLIGLAIWGVVFIGLSDNVLSPILIKRGMKIHPFLILLSVFGGLGFFGPIGFIAGPVALSLLFALFEIYPLITKKIIYEKSPN